MKMKMKKVFVLGVFALLGAMNMNAQCLVTEEIDTTYIKLDANQLPINYINLTKADLQEKVGELETIFENEEFGLYSAGDSTPTLAEYDFNSDNSKWNLKLQTR